MYFEALLKAFWRTFKDLLHVFLKIFVKKLWRLGKRCQTKMRLRPKQRRSSMPPTTSVFIVAHANMLPMLAARPSASQTCHGRAGAGDARSRKLAKTGSVTVEKHGSNAKSIVMRQTSCNKVKRLSKQQTWNRWLGSESCGILGKAESQSRSSWISLTSSSRT